MHFIIGLGIVVGLLAYPPTRNVLLALSGMAIVGFVVVSLYVQHISEIQRADMAAQQKQALDAFYASRTPAEREDDAAFEREFLSAKPNHPAP